MNGQKSMEPFSPNAFEEIKKAIVKTLAFFSLYELPLNVKSIHQLLYRVKAEEHEVSNALRALVNSEKVFERNNFYALKSWDESNLTQNKSEIAKRWDKVDRYFGVLSIIPFIDQVSIINSLAFGNAHQESDIDFFVVAQSGRLYLVRSIIIVLFRFLGVYKTRTQIADRFCFGFYVSSHKPQLEKVLIAGDDPLFAFWFASFAPLINRQAYLRLVTANRWIYDYFPNFDPQMRLGFIKEKNWFLRLVKGTLEIVLTIPAMILEPILARIHIRHTFNLPENHWPTATTVADRDMLKLHALDPRKDIRDRFNEVLQSRG